ncbi:adenylate/guanylate cyclase domain-containing protein [Pantanalinema rosaneae CENA516]|uniref:adenylate/guanylate cyclase domain-containing protein n=1 Tax=Pantanalinema rosaneae TaxID=1620701 RepID=UPI003D6E4DA1
MPLRLLPRWSLRLPRQISLRTILVVPFVVLIFLVVGLTGYLAFLNGQRTVNALAGQLQEEVSARIEQHLTSYLSSPVQINQLNLAATELELLNLADFDRAGKFFWKQMQVFPVSYISYCSVDGKFIGIERTDTGQLQWVEITDPSTNQVSSYETDERGNRSTFVESRDWNPQEEVWYTEPIQQKKPLWSEIYLWEDKPEIMSISASYPVYDTDRSLQGVLSVDLILSQIGQYLSNSRVSQSGMTFVLERSGLLVATSTQQSPIQIKDGTAHRIAAIDSSNSVVQATTQQLIQTFGDLQKIQASQVLQVMDQQSRLYVQVKPFTDQLGLNWLIVVVIPEADVMRQVYYNNRLTILLCLLALGVAVLLGLLASHWVTRPILQLSQAATALSQGKWNQRIPSSRLLEVSRLAQAFREMAGQLHQSFAELEDAKASLEARVEERMTEVRQTNRQLLEEVRERKRSESALRQAEEKYRSIVENAVEGIFQTSPEGRYLSANPALARLYRYDSPEELIASVTDVAQQIYVQPTRRAELTAYLQRFDEVSDFESEVYCQDGSRIWVAENVRAVKDKQGNILYYEGSARDITDRKLAEEELRRQRQRSEQLLLNILPQPIAERLKKGQQKIADSFSETSVLFADIANFTDLSSHISPTELVELLNQIFSVFDHLVEEYGLEKIKTIGDAYMVVSGLPHPRKDHVEAIADMALEMQHAIAEIRTHDNEPILLRIGINTGSVVAGVIGIRRFIYDLWGDTVNVASRMESHGEAGRIQVTHAVYERLKDNYEFDARGEISVKGKGDMMTYWLTGRQPHWSGTSRQSNTGKRKRYTQRDPVV